jgi:hypothetical protein
MQVVIIFPFIIILGALSTEAGMSFFGPVITACISWFIFRGAISEIRDAAATKRKNKREGE